VPKDSERRKEAEEGISNGVALIKAFLGAVLGATVNRLLKYYWSASS